MQSAPTAFRIPETMTLADIGPYCAELRTKYGLSLQDVSDRLHIRPRYISAIEAGNLSELPGAAYARGYVHSYAAFLGLDAAQVVAQCFSPKPAPTETPAAAAKPVFIHSAVAAVVPRAHNTSLTQKIISQWRGLAVAGVVAVIVILVIGQIFAAKSPEENAQPAVAAVPEDMLASIRTGLMPTAQNYRCFAGDIWLSCLNASQSMHEILTPDTFMLRELNEDDLAELESLADGTADGTDESGHDE